MNEIIAPNGPPPEHHPGTAISVIDTMAVLNGLTRAVSDPATDVNKVREIWQIIREVRADADARQRDIDAVLARQAFITSKVACDAAMPSVFRDKENTHTRSSYARLETVIATLKPIYTQHGFTVSFRKGVPDQAGDVRTIMIVSHIGGHTDEVHSDDPLDGAGAKGNTNKTPIQARQSSSSYAKRNMLLDYFNVAQEGADDDGNLGRDDPDGPPPPRKGGQQQPPAKPQKPALDPNSWLGKCEAAIGAAKSDAAWLKLMVEAGNRVPTITDLDELEEDFAPNLAKAPPDVRTTIKTAWAAGRKRLLAEKPPSNEAAKSDTPAKDAATFDRYLVDDYGEVLGEAYASRVKYAEDLLEIWRVADNRETLIVNNADAIADAKADPVADKMLAEIDDDPGETMDADDPLLNAVGVPVRNGKQDWAAYRKELIAACRAAENTAAWLNAQMEIITGASAAQRALIGKELAPILIEKGMIAPEWLTSPRAPGNRAAAAPAESPPAKPKPAMTKTEPPVDTRTSDQIQADALIASLQAIPDDAAGRGYFDTMTAVGSEMFKTMLRWRRDAPELFKKVDDEVIKKQALLPAAKA